MTDRRMCVSVPLRLESETNKASSEHWRRRAKRAKSQRNATRFACELLNARRFVEGCFADALKVAVTITRVHPPRNRIRDRHNVSASAKHVIDGIADAIGVNDSDPRVVYTVRQETGAWRAQIEIEGVDHECACGVCGRGIA